MANQEALQRISDSTLRELASIIENHNRNYQNPEVIALREELEKLQKEMEKKTKIRNGIEEENQAFTRKISEVVLHQKIQVETKDCQLKRLNLTSNEAVMMTEQAKMCFCQAMEIKSHKEQRLIREIKNLHVYIHGLHLTLERNGISSGRRNVQPDEYESEESNTQFEEENDVVQPDEVNSRDAVVQPETSNQSSQSDEFLVDELCSKNEDDQSQDASTTEAENFVVESDEPAEPQDDLWNIVASYPSSSNWCNMIEAEELESSQQSQSIEHSNIYLGENELSGNNEDESCQGVSTTEAENSVVESDEPVEPQSDQSHIVEANPQSLNCCDMIDADELEFKIEADEKQLDLGHVDLPVSEQSCKNVNDQSQEALTTKAENLVVKSDVLIEAENLSQLVEPDHSDGQVRSSSCMIQDGTSKEVSNIEGVSSVLKSDEPAEPDVPQKIKLDPFVHSYGEVQTVKLEEVKKPKKKQPKRKSKPKPKQKSKFSTCTTFGRI